MAERGATEQEVVATVLTGERYPVKLGRTGFRRNFPRAGAWAGRVYATKQLEVIAVREGGAWLVLTVVAKYF
jgi:hypothetical protein